MKCHHLPFRRIFSFVNLSSLQCCESDFRRLTFSADRKNVLQSIKAGLLNFSMLLLQDSWMRLLMFSRQFPQTKWNNYFFNIQKHYNYSAFALMTFNELTRRSCPEYINSFLIEYFTNSFPVL